jgi:hypothetical protein
MHFSSHPAYFATFRYRALKFTIAFDSMLSTPTLQFL